MELSKYFDYEIDEKQIDLWLNQFNQNEKNVIAKIVENFRYYSFKKVNDCLGNLHNKIMNIAGGKKVWYAPVGYVAKSGAMIVHLYKIENKISNNSFINIRDISKIDFNNEILVIMDDMIGSGHQATKLWNLAFKEKLLKKDAKVILATIVGFENGVEHLKKHTGFEIVFSEFVKSSELLSINSKMFSNDSEYKFAIEVLTKYGKILYPEYPLGYANTRSLLAFYYSCPNNTLPIFWASSNDWTPLLRSSETFRDPYNLIGPSRNIVQSEKQSYPYSDLIALNEQEMGEEMVIPLIKEFKLLKYCNIVAIMLSKLNVNESVLNGILKLMNRLKNEKHEKEPVKSAFLLVHEDYTIDNLYIEASSDMTIENENAIASLIQLTDSYSGCTVINSKGKVIGNILHNSNDSHNDIFLPDRYNILCNSTVSNNGILFLFDGNGKISIFSDGYRILSYRGAGWHEHGHYRGSKLGILAEKHLIKYDVLVGIIRLSIKMSDGDEGGFIVVGDHHEVIKMSEYPNNSHFKFKSINIIEYNDEALIGFFKQDGATIIDNDGNLIQTMVFLRPPALTEDELPKEVGKGTKHRTAAAISKLTKAIGIAVSVDGRITVYSNGEIAFKMMG